MKSYLSKLIQGEFHVFFKINYIIFVYRKNELHVVQRPSSGNFFSAASLRIMFLRMFQCANIIILSIATIYRNVHWVCLARLGNLYFFE